MCKRRVLSKLPEKPLCGWGSSGGCWIIVRVAVLPGTLGGKSCRQPSLADDYLPRLLLVGGKDLRAGEGICTGFVYASTSLQPITVLTVGLNMS